jgi:hypothetical protein
MTRYRIASVDVVQAEDRKVKAVTINLEEKERNYVHISVTVQKNDLTA